MKERVAISGNTIVVGAPKERSLATGANGNQNSFQGADNGAAYVFVRSGNSWAQQAYLNRGKWKIGGRLTGLAITPTATISNIMGSTPCIEPTFKNLFVKGNLSGA